MLSKHLSFFTVSALQWLAHPRSLLSEQFTAHAVCIANPVKSTRCSRCAQASPSRFPAAHMDARLLKSASCARCTPLISPVSQDRSPIARYLCVPAYPPASTPHLPFLKINSVSSSILSPAHFRSKSCHILSRRSGGCFKHVCEYRNLVQHTGALLEALLIYAKIVKNIMTVEYNLDKYFSTDAKIAMRP